MIKLRTTKLILLLVLMTSFFSSCVSPKEMIYYQEDEDYNLPISYNNNESIQIRPGDLLTIRVSASEQEAAQPFNLVKSVASTQNINGSVQLESYMVSNEGEIEFPVLGSVKVTGLTAFELAEKMKEQIREYVKDAIVNVRILNFKISVLGEVKNPGTFTIEDDHISLAQALGRAGDLTIYGKRENILVMREINGEKVTQRLDLTDEKVVSSPFYNLRQNDVVYVEPKVAKVQSASTLGVASRWLSIASLVTSLVILITK